MERHLKAEQDHQRRAFEHYFAQGGKRSHERVARELGVSVASVKSWSRSFNWANRVAERDAAVARQVADQSIRSEVDELGRNKKIVQMALIKVAKAINSDKVKVQVGDLDRLIRLQTFLDGGFVPPTLESFNRMDPVDVILLFNHWIEALSDDALRGLINALRTRESTSRGDQRQSIGMKFATNEGTKRDERSGHVSEPTPVQALPDSAPAPAETSNSD